MGALAAFDEIYQSVALPAFRQYLCRTAAVYLLQPEAAPAGPYDAMLGPERTEESDGQDGRKYKTYREVVFPFDPALPFWSPGNQMLAQFQIDSSIYAVDAVHAVSASTAEVRLVQIASAEVTRPGYRRRI